MATSMLRVGRAGAKSLRRHGRLMGTGIVVCAIVPTVYSVSHADAQVAALPLAAATVPAVAEQELVVSKTLSERAARFAADAKKAFKYFCRLVQYFLYGAPLLVGIPIAASGISPAVEDAVWDYLIWAIEQLGPAFIKMAQWASTRPDLYPPSLIQRLQKLQDDVTVRQSLTTVENTMSAAFGEEWKNHIELEPQPIGAGCIAQVYKGRLTTTSTEYENEGGSGKFGRRSILKGKESASKPEKQTIPVAIKLIHPHVEELIRTDMAMLNVFANFMDKSTALEILSLGDTIRQFAESMKDQLDLRKEAYNLKKFGSKFAKENWVLFPKPVDGFICKNVLVETFMEGTPIKTFMAKAEDGALGDKLRTLQLKLADLACRAMLKMIFFDNFVHGDLHPGNVMVQFMPSGEPRFVFLDCGIVFQAKSKEEHETLIDICLAFMKHDGLKAGELMVQKKEREELLRRKHSVENTKSSKHTVTPTAADRLVEDARLREIDQKRQENKDAFCKGLQKMINDTEQLKFFDHFGVYINRICDLARDFQVKLDPDYFHVAMVMKVAEGMALALDKEMDMITTCIPIVVKARAMQKLGIMKFPLPGDENDEIV